MRSEKIRPSGSTPGRPTVAWIDRSALLHNFAAVRAAVRPEVSVLAVVKADGYGHGAALAAAALTEAGADWLGVATVEEAVELRSAGLGCPILVLTGARPDQIDVVVQHDLRIALLDEAMARSFAARLGRRRIRAHLKLDTGMGRLGVCAERLDGVLEVVRSSPGLELEGVFSHFADADDAATELTDAQLARFRDGVHRVRAAGMEPRWVHLANSVATLTRPDTHGNLVRPGIVLYGIRPSGVPPSIQLRPAMHLRTCIWQLKEVPAGSALSYGGTFVTRRASRIGVLPIGYADGYARALSNRAQVLVRGRRVPVVGRVCMDVCLIDLTDVPDVECGEEVVLWGSQNGTELSVEEVAAWQGSIPHEVLTRLGKRVPRIALEPGALREREWSVPLEPGQLTLGGQESKEESQQPRSDTPRKLPQSNDSNVRRHGEDPTCSDQRE